MEIVGAKKYDHRKYDCPYIFSQALQLKYNKFPTLGVEVPNGEFMSKTRKGLKHYGLTPEVIDLKGTALFNYLLKNKKDGFLSLNHNTPKNVTHLVAFLYNYDHDALDLFDSYNKTRTLFTLRMNGNVKKFMNDFFHKYFEDEFSIAECYVFNYM